MLEFEMDKLEGIPKILYKYRTWYEPIPEIQYQRRILTNSEVYFASSSQFNDPFDASLPFKYREIDLKAENIYLKLKQIGRKIWTNISEQELERRCYERQNSGAFENGSFWKEFYPDFKKHVSQKYGILSLTTKFDNLLMWSHYADSHKGFCVGFDTRILFKSVSGGISPVIYNENFPELEIFDDFIANAYKLLCTKSKEWKYENEFRIIKIDSAKNSMIIPNECVKEIIIGCEMPIEYRKEIYKIHEERFSHATLYEAEKNIEEFKLNMNMILKINTIANK